MRFVIYGLGAVGGTIAAALTRSGHDVVAIARGSMLEAVRRDGLLFRTPAGSERFPLPVVGSPSELQFTDADVVLLTMKSQDTLAALDDLRDAGLAEQPVFCFQNGLNNERLALRYFPNVYATTVLLPADYITPGEVACYGTPKHGLFDMGRYPHGLDDTVAQVAAALVAANFAVFPLEDVLASKRGKLLENLGNVVEAAMGRGQRDPGIMQAVRAEAIAAYAAAGITEWVEISSNEPRRQGVMQMGAVDGASRAGSSSTQSLKRGTGSIETDYLNGEIVLLGRLHGVPVPLNAALCTLGADLAAGRVEPGSLSGEALAARLGL